MMVNASIVDEINGELARALEAFPEWPGDEIHAAGIVVEEAGELMQAALRSVYEDRGRELMRKEALHTATVAIRFLQNF